MLVLQCFYAILRNGYNFTKRMKRFVWIAILLISVLTTCTPEDREAWRKQVMQGSGPDAATVAVRARALPALAGIPAEGVDTWVAVNIDTLQDSARKLSGQRSPLPSSDQITSAAIAISGDTLQTLAALPQIQSMLEMGVCEGLLPMADMVPPAMQRRLQNTMKTRGNKALADTLKDIRNIPLPTLYASLSIRPGLEETARREAAKLMGDMMKEAGKKAAPFQADGWQGAKLNVGALAGKKGQTDSSPKYYYVAYRLQGSNLLVAGADEPGKLRYPATACDSVLGTAETNILDAAAKGSALFLAHADPATVEACRKLMLNSLNSSGRTLKELFPAGSANQTSESLATIATELSKIPECEHPLEFFVWQDGDLHLQADWDAGGASFETSELSVTPRNTDMLYACGTAFKPNRKVNMRNIVTATTTCAVGVSTLATGSGDYVTTLLPTLLENLMPHAESLLDGLGSGWALRIDNASTTEPARRNAPFVALSLDIADRRKLTQSWEQITKVINSIPGVSLDSVLKLQHTRKGDTTIYTAPDYNEKRQALFPALAMQDERMVLTSDSRRLSNSFDVPQKETGGIFVYINPAPRQTGSSPVPASVYKTISAGKLSITIDDGKMSTRLDLTTPCLK